MHESEELIREVLAAGARGYLLKSDATRQLIPAVESLSRQRPTSQGGSQPSFWTGTSKDARLNQPRLERATYLTRARGCPASCGREQQQSHCFALDLSVKTVETHRASVMRKLELNSLADIVRFAVRNHIIQP